MSKLKFPAAGLKKIMADNEAIRLVGDDGVYFLPAYDPKRAPNTPYDPDEIVYAEGCNPKVDEFDDWWEKKRATFGGDDGCEEIPVAVLLQALGDQDFLTVSFAKKSLRFS